MKKFFGRSPHRLPRALQPARVTDGGCFTTGVKYALCVFNLVFAPLGLALVIVGAMSKAYVAPLDFSDVVVEAVSTPASVQVAVGCIVLFVAMYGCVATVREGEFMLVTFGVTLLLLVGVQTTISLQILNGQSSMEEALNNEVNFKFTMLQNETAITKDHNYISSLQSKLKCCGPCPNGRHFYKAVPATCCDKGITPIQCNEKNAFYINCNDAARAEMTSLKAIQECIVGMASAVSIFKIIGAFSAFGLAVSVRRGINKTARARTQQTQ